MKVKEKTFIIGTALLLLFLSLCIKKCESYILDVKVVDKDDIFIFLYKNEHLLATSYYNIKPAYFFSFSKGEIRINLKIDYKENRLVKRKRKHYDLWAKSEKSSINILTHFNIHKHYIKTRNSDYFSNKYNLDIDPTPASVTTSVTTADENEKENEKEQRYSNEHGYSEEHEYLNEREGSHKLVTGKLTKFEDKDLQLLPQGNRIESEHILQKKKNKTATTTTTTTIDTTTVTTTTNNNNNSNNHNNNYDDDTYQPKKASNLFLVLITANQWLNYIKLKNKLEPSLLNEDNYIFTSHFNAVKRYPLNKGTLNKTIKINQENRYMLFLINTGKLKITVKGSVVYYDEQTKHLSREYLYVPQVLAFIAVILMILTTIMILCYFKYELKSDILMLLNNIFFLLSICFNYKNVKFIRDNGYIYVYYWVAASISKKIQEIIAFIIYLQVSLGNTYIRNSLSRVEVQFMICFSVISFYTGLFEIFLGHFQAPRYILQAFAYLFIFVAINFTSTFLSARMSEENLSFHVAELYQKYDIYKKYRLLFFAVILKPIILVIYKVLCLSPSNIDLYSSHEYFYVFLDIFFDVVLYFIFFLLFRPAKPIKLLKHVLNNEDFHIE